MATGEQVRIDDVTRALIAAGVTDPDVLRTSVAIAAREALGDSLSGTGTVESDLPETPGSASTWLRGPYDMNAVGHGVFQFTPGEDYAVKPMHPNMDGWTLEQQAQFFAQTYANNKDFSPWTYNPTYAAQVTHSDSSYVQAAQASIQRVATGQGTPPLSQSTATIAAKADQVLGSAPTPPGGNAPMNNYGVAGASPIPNARPGDGEQQPLPNATAADAARSNDLRNYTPLGSPQPTSQLQQDLRDGLPVLVTTPNGFPGSLYSIYDANNVQHYYYPDGSRETAEPFGTDTGNQQYAALKAAYLKDGPPSLGGLQVQAHTTTGGNKEISITPEQAKQLGTNGIPAAAPTGPGSIPQSGSATANAQAGAVNEAGQTGALGGGGPLSGKVNIPFVGNINPFAKPSTSSAAAPLPVGSPLDRGVGALTPTNGAQSAGQGGTVASNLLRPGTAAPSTGAQAGAQAGTAAEAARAVTTTVNPGGGSTPAPSTAFTPVRQPPNPAGYVPTGSLPPGSVGNAFRGNVFTSPDGRPLGSPYYTDPSARLGGYPTIVASNPGVTSIVSPAGGLGYNPLMLQAAQKGAASFDIPWGSLAQGAVNQIQMNPYAADNPLEEARLAGLQVKPESYTTNGLGQTVMNSNQFPVDSPNWNTPVNPNAGQMVSSTGSATRYASGGGLDITEPSVMIPARQLIPGQEVKATFGEVRPEAEFRHGGRVSIENHVAGMPRYPAGSQNQMLGQQLLGGPQPPPPMGAPGSAAYVSGGGLRLIPHFDVSDSFAAETGGQNAGGDQTSTVTGGTPAPTASGTAGGSAGGLTASAPTTTTTAPPAQATATAAPTTSSTNSSGINTNYTLPAAPALPAAGTENQSSGQADPNYAPSLTSFNAQGQRNPTQTRYLTNAQAYDAAYNNWLKSLDAMTGGIDQQRLDALNQLNSPQSQADAQAVAAKQRLQEDTDYKFPAAGLKTPIDVMPALGQNGTTGGALGPGLRWALLDPQTQYDRMNTQLGTLSSILNNQITAARNQASIDHANFMARFGGGSGGGSGGSGGSGGGSSDPTRGGTVASNGTGYATIGSLLSSGRIIQ